MYYRTLLYLQVLIKAVCTPKYGDVNKKLYFLKIQDLSPLNTCEKRLETILPNLPLDECEIRP